MVAELPSARLRWAVNVAAWNPSDEEFSFLQSLLNEEERAEVSRMARADDRKRSMVSRLLRRAMCSRALGVAWSEVKIDKTKGRKPFAVAPGGRNPPWAPNFNFNISHEGDWVVGVAEGFCLCGVDVAAPPEMRPKAEGPWDTFRASMRDQLTEAEWGYVERGDGDRDKRLRFQVLWSLKESFVKARGDGLGFCFKDCEFEFECGVTSEGPPTWPPRSARVRVRTEGVMREAPDWRFDVCRIGKDHVISVARGPVRDCVDARGVFKSTFSRPDLAREEIAAECASAPPFAVLTVADLLPHDAVAGYEAAGGDVL